MQRVPAPRRHRLSRTSIPQGWNEGVQHVALADIDNDGRPDILAGGRDYSYQYGTLFIQQPDGTFQELGSDWGFHFPCAGGLSVADLDRDGDLDIIARQPVAKLRSRNTAAAVDRAGRRCSNPADGGVLDPGFGGYDNYAIHIFSNNAGEHSSWLEIRLRGDGTTTNAMGIGARVTVTANGVAQVQEMAEHLRPDHRGQRRRRAVLRSGQLRNGGFDRRALAEPGAEHRRLRRRSGQSSDRAAPGGPRTSTR